MDQVTLGVVHQPHSAMALRRDPPQDVQWRAGHTTSAMTEKYIAEARYQAGANFGEPLPPLPRELSARRKSTLRSNEGLSQRKNGGGAGNRMAFCVFR